jgi:rubrerythrin
MAKTLDHLKEAFAGESQANRKYLAFSKKADEEGFPQAARLFRAAAEAETVHALAHLDAMKGVKSTKDNLQAAISGETFEFTQMYPDMIKRAEKEGQEEAKMSFDNANKVEAIHADLYQKVLDNIDKDMKIVYHVCQICGNTVENDAPDVCPVCGSPKKMFKKID